MFWALAFVTSDSMCVVILKHRTSCEEKPGSFAWLSCFISSNDKSAQHITYSTDTYSHPWLSPSLLKRVSLPKRWGKSQKQPGRLNMDPNQRPCHAGARGVLTCRPPSAKQLFVAPEESLLQSVLQKLV